MPIRQIHKSDIKKAQDGLIEKVLSAEDPWALDTEEVIRSAHRAGFRIPIPDKKDVSPLHFYKDPITGLKFKVKLESKKKPNRLRCCSECGDGFIVIESGHYGQCSYECFKKYKARDQKKRRDVKRQKAYEKIPSDDRPDGFCKICHKDISYRRAGALICENPAHRKQWNRMKKREDDTQV